MYPTFVNGNGSGKTLRLDSGLSYVPSSNVLTAGTFSGSGASLTALNADNISSGTLASARIEDNAVTFDKLEDVANSRILGRVSSGAGNAEELTATQVRTLLNVADGANVGITTASSNVVGTWSVTANGSSAYRFTGPGQSGDEDNPDIYLVRGQRYSFINTTGSSHPFRFRVSSGGSTYSDGVSGSENGTQYFNVQHDAPASLVYQCTIHGGMVGNIYIVGQHLANGADNRVLTATSAYGMTGESTLTYNGSGVLEIDDSGSSYTLKGASAKHEIGASASDNDLVIQNNKNTVNATSNIIFKGSGSGGESVKERLRITSSGRVGINTTSDSMDGVTGNLNIANTNFNNHTVINLSRNTASDRPQIRFQNTNGNVGSIDTFGSDLIISSGNELKFRTNSNERVIIASDGKLLIDRTVSSTSGNHPALEIETICSGSEDTTFATGIDFKVDGVHKKRLAVTDGTGEGGGDWIFYRDNGVDEGLRITSTGQREIRDYHYGPWAFTNNTAKTTITVGDPGDNKFTTIKLILTLIDGSYRQGIWQGEYTIFASNAVGGPGVNYYLKELWQQVGSANWSGGVVSVQITSGGALQVTADNGHDDAAGNAYIHILDVIGHIDGSTVASISS